MSGYDVIELPVERTYDLRRSVLRDGTPTRQVELAGDDDPTTFHLGALGTDGRIVAVSSWMPMAWPDEPELAAVRLRGMASDPTVRGSGIGGAVLGAGIDRCRREASAIVWAHARIPALEFYRRHGFRTVGDEFIDHDHTALPHIVIRLDL